MTSQLVFLSCIMGALSAAGSATTSSQSFNWASIDGKSYLPPIAEAVVSLDDARCFERGVNTAIEGAMAAALGEPGYHINLSNQYTYQCSNDNGKCNIAGPYEGVCEQIKQGLTDENCVPMGETSTLTSCNANNCSDINNRLVKTNNCSVNSSNNETSLKQMLLDNGPIAVSMNFFESFKNYKSGVYTKEENDTLLGAFTVTLTGWETSINDLSTIFIARNDYFGEKWGEKGYFKISAKDIASLVCNDTDVCFAAYATAVKFDDTAKLPGSICLDSDSTINLGDVSKFDTENGSAITIRNCGKNVVAWSSDAGTKLTINPPAGTLAAGQETTINISINVASDDVVAGNLEQILNIQSLMSYNVPVTVKAKIIQPSEPVVDFVADKYAGYAPLTVNFTNTTKGDEITKYEWSFGEGSVISNKENPSYEYVKAGDYDVTLTITWAGGKIEKKKAGLIAVYNKPGDTEEKDPQEVKTGCNATSGSDFAIWALLAIFFMILPQKRLN